MKYKYTSSRKDVYKRQLLQQIPTEAEPIERVERHAKELRQLKPDSGIREKQQIASAAEEQTERRPLCQRSDDQDKPCLLYTSRCV